MLKTTRHNESLSLRKIPSTDIMLKIGLGLVFMAILTQAFVFAETVSVDIDGTSFDIEYTGNGVTVSGTEVDMDFISVILTVDVTGSPGVFDITFDRSFFDSVYQGLDDQFIVLADGDEPSFSETSTTAQSRTLQIELPAGTEEVEIIGSVFNQPIEETPEEIPEEPEETAPEKQIPALFVESDKSAKYYVERYVNEASYKVWFEENYSDYTFYEALNISESEFNSLVAEIEAENAVAEAPEEVSEVVEETPKTQCGPGTVLKDGACVLDERCGPGTTLVDGVCVLDSTPEAVTPDVDSTPKLKPGNTKELGIGLIAAFIIAGVVAIILGIMAKASRRKENRI